MDFYHYEFVDLLPFSLKIFDVRSMVITNRKYINWNRCCLVVSTFKDEAKQIIKWLAEKRKTERKPLRRRGLSYKIIEVKRIEELLVMVFYLFNFLITAIKLENCYMLCLSAVV